MVPSMAASSRSQSTTPASSPGAACTARIDEGPVVPRFGRPKLRVECGEVVVSSLELGREQGEALTRARLDEGADQETIDRSSHALADTRRPERPLRATKCGDVRVRRRVAERDATRLEHGMHTLEMLNLFFGQVGKGAHDHGIIGVTRRHRQRIGGCLELAVSVIDQHGREVAAREGCPARIARDGQVKHGRSIPRQGGRARFLRAPSHAPA